MTMWFRLPLVVRLVVIALACFGYGVLILDFNALDIGSRSAKIIGTACLVGLRSRSGSTWVGARPVRWTSSRHTAGHYGAANCQRPSNSTSGGAGLSAAIC
ncbi:MAG: hypothetical protein QOI25_5534 [Mycobacterium sp.]|jgi:hypothetical protein|nr:hypothetical protein [Mycobacterium sp.]